MRVLAGAYVFYLGGISWLLTTGTYNPFAYVGVPLLALYMTLYPAGAAWVLRRWFAGLPPLRRFFVFAAMWLLFEWFRTLGRLSMPFTLIGHSWVAWPSAIQSAEFFGEIGVSLQILLISATILAFARLPVLARGVTRVPDWAAILHEEGTTATKAALSTGNIFFWTFAMLTVSGLRYQQWERRIDAAPPESRIKVAALQPKVLQDVKLASYLSDDENERRRLQEEINQLHETLIASEVPKDIDLLVMPESTFPAIDFDVDAPLHRRIERLLQPFKADCLFGAVRITLTPERTLNEVFNTAYFLPAGGMVEKAGHQDKMRLVPFGEYLPYFNLIPGFQEGIVGIASFEEGREVNLFTTQGHKHGSLICFESTFGTQSRRLARAGAEFISIITNDAWYRQSAGPVQHHNLSILRAVETRRPVIRSANTGISSIISPSGRITETLGVYERGVVTGEIVPQTFETFYVRWGNVWVVGACLITIAGGVLRIRRKN